jgi:hypothetical protein
MQKPRLFWIGCVLTLEGGLGAWEGISFHYHGISLSETCGKTMAAYPVWGLVSLIIFAVGFTALIVHLWLWKKISEKKNKCTP